MWWWHQQHFWTQNVDTVNILGSGSIGYVMDVNQFNHSFEMIFCYTPDDVQTP